MNIEQYIESGILQDYCLGLLTYAERAQVELVCELNPTVKDELILLQRGLEKFVVENPIWNKAALKKKIWNTLNNIQTEENRDINHLPLINKYSDHNNWLSIVRPLLPAQLDEDTYMSVIRGTEQVTQLVTMSVIGHLEEIHEDIYESFLILEGECVCQIGDKFIEMKAGGYIEIPLYTKHNVKVLSPHIIAIVQRVAV